MNYSTGYLVGLVKELCKLPAETEWVEFRHNQANSDELGEDLSALSNAAALAGKAHAYLVWGVSEGARETVGTFFKPSRLTMGNVEFENWLPHLLTPNNNYRFYSFETDGKHMALLEIGAACSHPVRFKQQEFIRVGPHTKKLHEYPDKERELRRMLDTVPFERGIEVQGISGEAVLVRLDYPSYFDLLELPLPDGINAILEALESDGLISRCEAGNWNITRMGALLFAKNLDDFPELRRKVVRVIHYKGRNRVGAFREQVGTKGYAGGFKGLISNIMSAIPSTEIIRQSLRETVPTFPEVAVRELVANALIHQDFFVAGAGPMVEIFEDRMEVASPGEPLVDPRRFLDAPPHSRNEILATFMRRFGICGERGSGIDNVAHSIELFQMPAPKFEQAEGFAKATLFARRPLNQLDKSDRTRACYLHACLKRVTGDCLSNASLRKRLGVEDKNKAAVSRYIREALTEGVIKPLAEDASRKLMKYVPYWA
ncbi:MAG: putative DNA binding domain-containing protein [Deltaproteobacteria bacterium]|jgi:predicted HTH transcriptional regulator|nr:putative DNA binding domain-containing protein [Deltaproteobacteria bacterium]